jgi:hypothetical protein
MQASWFHFKPRCNARFQWTHTQTRREMHKTLSTRARYKGQEQLGRSVILKRTLMKKNVRAPGTDQQVVPCKHSNEPSDFIQRRQWLTITPSTNAVLWSYMLILTTHPLLRARILTFIQHGYYLLRWDAVYFGTHNQLIPPPTLKIVSPEHWYVRCYLQE